VIGSGGDAASSMRDPVGSAQTSGLGVAAAVSCCAGQLEVQPGRDQAAEGPRARNAFRFGPARHRKKACTAARAMRRTARGR